MTGTFSQRLNLPKQDSSLVVVGVCSVGVFGRPLGKADSVGAVKGSDRELFHRSCLAISHRTGLVSPVVVVIAAIGRRVWILVWISAVNPTDSEGALVSPLQLLGL